MELNAPLRPGRREDAPTIAELVAVASDGVAMVEWTLDAALAPGRTPLDIGARTYAREDGNYSYRNTVVVEERGQVVGMLLSFPMPARPESERPAPPPYDGSDVFAPYKYLEAPNTWYVCGIALRPDHRGLGLGTRLMQVARVQARERSYERLSLVVFEQNGQALRLYRQLGFEVVGRAPIVPHPLIHGTGDALLMVAPV